MSEDFIYFVGKPYPRPEAVQTIRNKGFGAGILLDKKVRLKNPERYDRVVAADFSSRESLLKSLGDKDAQIAGLICTYENYIVARARLGEHLGLLTQSVQSAKMCTDKFLMREAFASYDPAITPQFGIVSSETDVQEIAKRLGFPLILKPTNLVKSLLVFRCDDYTELIENFRYAQQHVARLYEKHNIRGHVPKLIVEEFIEGRLCSIAAFVDHEGTPHFCDGLVSLVNARDVGMSDNFLYARYLPADIPNELQARLMEVARKGIAALQLKATPAHVELIYNDREIKLVEIGARIGGYRPRMYANSYGIDMIEQEINLALGVKPEVTGNLRANTAVFELFPEREGWFDRIAGNAETDSFAYYAVKPSQGTKIGPAKNGHKATAIIIVSEEDKTRFNVLCKQVDNLKVVVR